MQDRHGVFERIRLDRHAMMARYGYPYRVHEYRDRGTPAPSVLGIRLVSARPHSEAPLEPMMPLQPPGGRHVLQDVSRNEASREMNGMACAGAVPPRLRVRSAAPRSIGERRS